jgi:hypothetical protein
MTTFCKTRKSDLEKCFTSQKWVIAEPGARYSLSAKGAGERSRTETVPLGGIVTAKKCTWLFKRTQASAAPGDAP